MKIIFLDIDGVLSTPHAYDQPGHKHGRANEFTPWLKEIWEDFLKDHPEVTIVLSSTWRKDSKWRERIYGSSRITAGRIIDVTDSSRTGFRGSEVQNWLNDTELDIEEYVILDDSGDFYPDQIESRYVKTKTMHGISPRHLREVAKILKLEELS
jgi:hypothetical protein